jgi:hypothetical protein
MPRIYPLLCISLLLTACSTTPTLEDKPSSEFIGLNKVSGSGFSEAWGRPGAGLANYRVVQVSPLQSAGAEIVQPASSTRASQDWQLTTQRQAALQAGWAEAMGAAAQKHGLDTSGNGEKVLRIEATLTRIAPSANLQQEQQSPGRSTVYTEDSGEASAEFRFYDDASGELLAIIRDKRRVGNQVWGRASTVSASGDVRRLFNSWANQLLSRITGLPVSTHQEIDP